MFPSPFPSKKEFYTLSLQLPRPPLQRAYDQSNIDLYKKQGSEAFTFETKGRVSTMISYWKVPLIIMEDETQLKGWVEQSYNISLKNNKNGYNKKG